jgi:curved DNA-binding protein CbpA
MRHPETDSFYDLLGVCRDASPGEIRAAFLKMAERHHPDRNMDDPEADERFKRIRRVYEILRDPLLRAAYDDHPHHFRLSDADVLGRDSGPIVSHPMPTRAATGGWGDSASAHAASNLWPTWRRDGGRARESRFAFAAAIATMITLAVVSVLLVRARGRAPSSAEHSIASEKTFTSLAVEPMESDATPAASPLDQVFSSVQDLRADSANYANDAASATVDTSVSETAFPRRPLQLPPFDVIDEFNLPFPGWPLIIPPIEVPLFNPPRDRAGDTIEPQPTTDDLLEARVSVRQSSWAAPSTLSYPAPAPAASSASMRSATQFAAPPSHAAAPAAGEMETSWSAPAAGSWNRAESGPVMYSYSDMGSLPTRGPSIPGLPELPVEVPAVVATPSPLVRPIVRSLVTGLPGLTTPPSGTYNESLYPSTGVANLRRPLAGELNSRIGAATVPNWTLPSGMRSVSASTVLPRAGRPGAAVPNMGRRDRSIEALRTSPAPPAWSGLPMNNLSAPGLPPIDRPPLP